MSSFSPRSRIRILFDFDELDAGLVKPDVFLDLGGEALDHFLRGTKSDVRRAEIVEEVARPSPRREYVEQVVDHVVELFARRSAKKVFTQEHDDLASRLDVGPRDPTIEQDAVGRLAIGRKPVVSQKARTLLGPSQTGPARVRLHLEPRHERNAEWR